MSNDSELKVITFPGTPNLPLYASQAQGFFAAEGLAPEFHTTPSSTFQIEQLVAGEFQIAGTAIDNIIAYQEGQGAVELASDPDLFVFMGASQIELSLVARPDIESIAALGDEGIALDALTTGFAFVAYWMLEQGGLDPMACNLVPVGATPQRMAALTSGEQACALLLEPFTGQAKAAGYRVLASSAKVLPNYQGGVFGASQSWANGHRDELVGFIRAYLRGLKWVSTPNNREAAKALLCEHLPNLAPPMADNALTRLLDPATGLTPAAAIDLERVETVLSLRNRYAPSAKTLDEPARYLNLKYYDAALKA